MGGGAIREGKWHLISADNAARHIILHAHTPIFDKGHWPPWKSQVDKNASYVLITWREIGWNIFWVHLTYLPPCDADVDVMERNGCRYLHCPPLRHGGIPECPIFCEKRVFQMFTSPSIWDTVPHKVLFFWGTGFIKDIFRCFYCYPFKEHAFVSKKAKILFLLRCAWKGTRTGLFLISFAWPHGQAGPPL